MGACAFVRQSSDENTKMIDQRMDEESKADAAIHKLLILGPGGSGKSTIFKQLQCLHGGGFSKKDSLMLRSYIYFQVTKQMQTAIKHYIDPAVDKSHSLHTLPPPKHVSTGRRNPHSNAGGGGGASSSLANGSTTTNGSVETTTNDELPQIEMQMHLATHSGDEDTTVIQETNASQKREDKQIASNSMESGNINDDPRLSEAIQIVMNHSNLHTFRKEVGDAIKYIYQTHPKLQNVFVERRKGNDLERQKILTETTEVFWRDIDRISDPEYMPSEQDIINVRYRTSGITDKKFTIAKSHFHIFDCGGQHSERKKWIRYFVDVRALIFVISLSCFDEITFANAELNCMEDSLVLFKETIHNKLFVDTHSILFLNKRDLFANKILKVPITDCPVFGDFETFKHETTIHSNPHDYEQTTAYIRHKFESIANEQVNGQRKRIYTHITCAMDKGNIEHVFNAVKHILISGNIMREGLS